MTQLFEQIWGYINLQECNVILQYSAMSF